MEAPRTYAAFLRGISNTPMHPFRAKLEALGFTDVRSFGASGNLVFCSTPVQAAELERGIGEAVGTEAFVRTLDELAEITADNPFSGREGAAVFLGKRPIGREAEAALLSAGFAGEPPVVIGANIFFIHPTRRPGRNTIVDFEGELDVRGTMRSAHVVQRVLDIMSQECS